VQVGRDLYWDIGGISIAGRNCRLVFFASDFSVWGIVKLFTG
jgi:hypothetical protein